MAKYIFVDIDGPLLPGKMHLFPINQKITRAKLNEAEPMFDQFAVRCFNLWAKYADAKIVFSTNWATGLTYPPDDHLKAIMFANGLDFTNRYHEDLLTPKRFTSQRGTEIWGWLCDTAKDGASFIAVDDDQECRHIKSYLEHAENNELPKVNGEWIEVDFTNGMSWDNFYDGCEALDINMDDINEGEFGIKPLTAEEKAKREEALKLLANCII